MLLIVCPIQSVMISSFVQHRFSIFCRPFRSTNITVRLYWQYRNCPANLLNCLKRLCVFSSYYIFTNQPVELLVRPVVKLATAIDYVTSYLLYSVATQLISSLLCYPPCPAEQPPCPALRFHHRGLLRSAIAFYRVALVAPL